MRMKHVIEYEVDFAHFTNDSEMGTGWYAIIRGLGGSMDAWLGPYSSKRLALAAARRELKE